MEKLLGIDYGKRRIGLAISIGSLAEVYGVVHFKTVNEALEKIKRIAEKENVQGIVIGVSEGEMALESKNFAKELVKELETPVFFQDETLSTHFAQKLSREAGVGKKKRRKLEDAFAAAVILQDYLNLRIAK
mgnify:CR=1 FL=1